jgi:hypothetical protein
MADPVLTAAVDRSLAAGSARFTRKMGPERVLSDQFVCCRGVCSTTEPWWYRARMRLASPGMLAVASPAGRRALGWLLCRERKIVGRPTDGIAGSQSPTALLTDLRDLRAVTVVSRDADGEGAVVLAGAAPPDGQSGELDRTGGEEVRVVVRDGLVTQVSFPNVDDSMSTLHIVVDLFDYGVRLD